MEEEDEPEDRKDNIIKEFAPKPSLRLSGLSRDGTRSAFTPYKPCTSTVLTNLQRGNVQTQTPSVLPERSIHQLAAQGELFLQNLDENFNANAKDENGYTPLMWASCYGQLATVRGLLEHGATVSNRGKMGETALSFASASGHVSVLKELLKHGVDIDGKDDEGNTALMYTAYGNHAHCAYELLLSGADLTVENNGSETAYEIAVKQRNRLVQSVIEKHMMKLLTGS